MRRDPALLRAGHGLAGLAAVALGVVAATGAAAAPQAPPAAAASQLPAVSRQPHTAAVAPFANLSDNPDDDWIAAGIAETVATDLEQLPAFTVVAREAFAAAYGAGASPGTRPGPAGGRAREVARALGASRLVAGGFQRLGGQLRITASVVDAGTGAVLRAVTVDGTMDELFALQDRVSRALRDALVATAPPPGGMPRPRAAALPSPAAPPPAAARPADVAAVPGLPAFPAGAAGETGAAARPAPGPRRGGAFGAAPAPAAPSAEASPPSPGEAAESRPVASSPNVPRARRRTFAGVPSDSVLPGDVTGGIALGDAGPRLGVAAEAGVLTGRPTVRPPRIQQAPAIDGRLDDAAWRSAAAITDFVQRRPLDGAPATEATEVYVAYDSANIYIGVYAHYSDPSMMRANRADRDRPIADDTFLVYFDPFLDQQRAYVFGVNGYGVQSDSILDSRGGGGGLGGGGGGGLRGRRGFGPGRGGPGGAPRGDRSWDALFTTAGQLVADGFTAEMAIPFKSLRYPQRGGGAPHRWGFQLARTIRGKDESVVWSPVSRSVAGFLTQMGVIEGLTGLSTSRNIEILPTFTAVRFGALDTATGTFSDGDPRPEGGVNFKYGVTSNLTADLTFNPDFSQIESDQPQIEVNQRFALFYPELRPFFLEGAEIFQFLAPVRLVHTRTIVDPRYGAKLTGKVGDTTIGVMYADDEAPGNLDDADDPALGQSAQTFVGRVRYDLYAESHVGAIFTERQFLDGYNRVAGLDSNFRIGDTHSFGVRAIGSRDRDPGSGEETSGYLLNASLQKTGRNLSYAFGWYNLSPDFATDVGFVERTDQRWALGNVSYLWWPETWLVNWGPRATYSRGYNFEGILEDEDASAGIEFAFAKNITFSADADRILERFGGIDFLKTRFSSFTTVSTSRRIAFGMGFNRGDQIFFDADNPFLGFDTGWIWFINARLIPRLQSNINITTNRFIDPRNDDALVFDVKIVRALTTYQFTDRFLLRNISEYNSFDGALGLNLLFTYRVNAGTVFYVGYDDRYQQAERIDRGLHGRELDNRFFQSSALRRTNRAVFLKLQYLFRY